MPKNWYESSDSGGPSELEILSPNLIFEKQPVVPPESRLTDQKRSDYSWKLFQHW